MTHLSRVLDNAGIPEDLKRKIGEAAGKDAAQLKAAKYIVWSAQWAFHKLLRQGRIMPHAECEHFAEMMPKVEKWLEINGQVGVNFKEGRADLEAALAAQEEA